MTNSQTVRREPRSAHPPPSRPDPQPPCTHPTSSQTHPRLSATGRQETRRRWLCWVEHAQAGRPEVCQGWRKEEGCSRQEWQGRSVEDIQCEGQRKEIEFQHSEIESGRKLSLPMSVPRKTKRTSICCSDQVCIRIHYSVTHRKGRLYTFRHSVGEVEQHIVYSS